MQKKALLVLSLLIWGIMGISQSAPKPLPPLSTDWQRIHVKDVGSFDLPPTMEIQKGKYKEYADKVNHIFGYDASQLVAQQKGLNDLGASAFEKYARVMLETTIGAPGDYGKLQDDLPAIDAAEIANMTATFKNQVADGLAATGTKVIKFDPVRFEKVNGMTCLHISFERQAPNKPPVLVQAYYFHNYDRKHVLTLSYRTSESDIWKADFATVLKSFRISNIKPL